MLNECIARAEQQLYATGRELMDDIITRVYPHLFAYACSLTAHAKYLQEEADGMMIVTLTEKISDELEMLYQKEKLVLFPYISRLHASGEKSGTCAPFKNVKQVYSSLIRLITELCEVMKKDGDPRTSSAAFLEELLKFRQQNIRFQLFKENYIFSKVKSCTGCRVNSVEF